MLDELAHYVQVDVGFQKRHADFAQRLGHVLFGERALSAQVFKRPLQLISQVLKHRSNSSVSECRGATAGERPPDRSVSRPALPGTVPAFRRDTCRWSGAA